MTKHTAKSKRKTSKCIKQEFFVLVTTLFACFIVFTSHRLVIDDSSLQGLHPTETNLRLQNNAVSHSSTKNLPFQMWKQYREWHSQDALERELQQLGGPAPDRKFSIVYYSCPHQAGNRMRNFAESMIWSLLTNRTALWKYYSDNECKRVSQDFSPVYCQGSYNVSVCNNILARSSLLPSYTEWKSKLRLSEHTPRMLRHWVTHPLDSNISHPDNLTHLPRYYSYPEALTDNGIVDTLEETVVVFPFAFLDSISNLAVPEIRERILTTNVVRDRALALLTEPHHYIYGLVRHENFQIQPYHQVPPQYPTQKGVSSGGHPSNGVAIEQPSGPPTWRVDPVRRGLTVIVHSRHMKKTNDGSNIHHELECLEPFLSNLTQGDFCQLVLLSDRETTLLVMQEYVAQRTYPDCHIVVVPRSLRQEKMAPNKGNRGGKRASYWDEHGPFAGAGFFQDMSLVANQLRHVPTTRTAFVAADRSSNFLVEDTIHYELYRRHGHELGYSLSLERCVLGGSRDEYSTSNTSTTTAA